MVILENFLEHASLVFVLVLARVAALMATFPLLGGPSVPVRARALLTVGVALLLLPLQRGTALPPIVTLVDLAVQVLGETIVGVTLGLALSMLLAGMQIAGQVISQMAGLSIAEVLNPTFDENAPVYSLLFYLLATTVFFALGGHVVALETLLETYEAAPLASVWGEAGGTVLEGSCQLLLKLAGDGFVLGVRAAAPAIASLLVATTVLGLIGRTMPQFNVFALGFGMNGLITLGTLFFSLGAAMWAFQEEVSPVLHQVLYAIRGATP